MKKCICLLWLLMAVCFCSPAGAETGLYFLSWDMDGDAVCYALEVTTEDGEVLYADDSVWQNEVIFPADIPSEAEEKIFWRVRPFDLYGGPLHGWTEREPFEAVGSFLEREAPLLRPDNHEDRRMKLLYPVYSYVGLPGAKSYEVEVTDSEPENPDGTEPSMYRVWSKVSEIMELYDDFPRTGVYWWRVRCLDEDGNALGVWSEAQRMEMPVDGWETGLFGDSISHGGGHISYGPADHEFSWLSYLNFPAINLSMSGDTSETMLERFEADVLPFHPRYLLILNGTNSLRAGVSAAEVIADGLTAERAVAYYARFFADFDADKARDLIRFFKLPADRTIKEMSKGMGEKLRIALTMSRRARVYLLDEPISGVDPAAREVLMNGILTDFNPDSLLLISTHLIADVEPIVDSVVFLHEGGLMLAGDADDLREASGMSLDALFRKEYR